MIDLSLEYFCCLELTVARLYKTIIYFVHTYRYKLCTCSTYVCHSVLEIQVCYNNLVPGHGYMHTPNPCRVTTNHEAAIKKIHEIIKNTKD